MLLVAKVCVYVNMRVPMCVCPVLCAYIVYCVLCGCGLHLFIYVRCACVPLCLHVSAKSLGKFPHPPSPPPALDFKTGILYQAHTHTHTGTHKLRKDSPRMRFTNQVYFGEILKDYMDWSLAKLDTRCLLYLFSCPYRAGHLRSLYPLVPTRGCKKYKSVNQLLLTFTGYICKGNISRFLTPYLWDLETSG